MTLQTSTSTPVETVVEALLQRLADAHAVPLSSIERARRAAGADPRIDRVMTKLGLLEERALLDAWSKVTGLAVATPFQFPAQPVLANVLSPRFLRSAEILPLSVAHDVITIAVTDPIDQYALTAIRTRTGLRPERVLATTSDIREAHDRLYPVEAQVGPAPSADVAVSDLTRLKDLATDAPAILMVNAIIERAVALKASDVHLAAGRSGTRLRYRVDGVLRDEEPPSSAAYGAIISRVKVLAELDITERRLPQDGRIRFGVGGREIDLRIATMPHLEAEGVVLRILDRSAVQLDLPALGFSTETEGELSKLLSEPHGIFLVTGPTGSGKTTTLYAALRKMVRPERNVVSVEDPVEYQLDGVAQIQVQRKIGLTFPTALRAILRQDPDIIMIGEIRDPETAQIANQAALTGHFVLATLHTNSAAASFPRLIDMGLEPYLLSSTIRGALSQRLVRLLCQACARPLQGNDGLLRDRLKRLAELTSLSPSLDLVRTPGGCPQCNGSGYRGRIAIAEILSSNDELRHAILRRADASEIEALQRKANPNSLLRSGLEKILQGRSTLTEVLHAAGGELLS